ncbi:hypothetical protein [Nonomuraea soli]|uniref:Uncharacterized protein n=1 Tax=Nonomuraea soli TaxID=1032476 RepID=A0A7W0CEJ4_9ACTN|nr:hypothetical protein [Nonomuraea soli]MBA2889699.1 hypothetical protein [Nonomuraea soli]
MILISAGLVLAAIVLLIAGFVLTKPFLIMWSIVVCVLSALFLVIGAYLRRHELFPGGRKAGAPVEPGQKAAQPSAVTAPHAHVGQPQAVPPRTPVLQAQPMGAPPTLPRPHPVPPGRPHSRPAAGGISPDALVLVIPGRKRYHVAGCRQLIGRDHEELTYEEAREEGFSPCTSCLPDAALGGRQLPPVDPTESGTTSASPSIGLPASGGAPPGAHPSTPRPGAPSSGAPSTGAASPGAASTGAGSTGAASSGSVSFGATSAGAPPSGPPSAGPASSGASPLGATSPGSAASGAHSSGATQPGAPSPGAASPASSDDDAAATTGSDDPRMAGPTRELRVPRPGDLAAATPSPAQTPASPKPEATGGWFTREEPESAGTRVNPYAAERAEAPSEGAGSQATGRETPASGKAVTGASEGTRRAEDELPADDASPAAASASEPVTTADERPATQPESSGPTSGDAAPEESVPEVSAPGESVPESSAPKAQTAETVSEAEAPRGDDDTGPVPVVRAEDEGGGRSGTVTVIVGTRRFHSATCPLVKGAGDNGVESMTVAAAEAAGLTACSVCQHERESVG